MSGIGWWYDALCAAVLGALTASFLCVCAERIPRGLSIGGRSRCACGRQLRWGENIPIIGWLRAGGVSGCCGAPIPRVYVVVEALLAATWGVAGALIGWNALAALLLAAVSAVGATWTAMRVLNRTGTN